MRDTPSVLHLDMDSFFASVEQRDKCSLRGRPVIVGGTGGRGVVATASYEARAYGARSAMPTGEARHLCPPGTAFLAPRFAAYKAASNEVMRLLRELSPLVEPLSLDEAFLDLAASGTSDLTVDGVRNTAETLKNDIRAATGLTASIGVGTSKLIAKIASDLDKPNGLVIVEPGTELDVLGPLPVSRIPGVGPSTQKKLTQLGVTTITQLRRLDVGELTSAFGTSHGRSLYDKARAEDSRTITVEREAKSASAETTFDTDITDRNRLNRELDLLASKTAGRMQSAGLSGRTVTLKVRLYDFATLTRSSTLPQPTQDARVLAQVARRLLRDVAVEDGVRLLGVGASGLLEFSQDSLFEDPDLPPADAAPAGPAAASGAGAAVLQGYRPGQDVMHTEYGPGWVWGSGTGRVTVRFEGPHTGPGPVRTFTVGDPHLSPADPPVWLPTP